MTFDLAETSEERRLIVYGLLDGDGSPLADHLEAGGELYDDQRAALVKYLRGEAKRRRGRPRTFSQQWKEVRIRSRVLMLQHSLAMRDGSYGSLQKAYDTYLDQDPDISLESLRKYVENNGGGLSKSQLGLIDEIRVELFRKPKSRSRTTVGKS